VQTNATPYFFAVFAVFAVQRRGNSKISFGCFLHHYENPRKGIEDVLCFLEIVKAPKRIVWRMKIIFSRIEPIISSQRTSSPGYRKQRSLKEDRHQAEEDLLDFNEDLQNDSEDFKLSKNICKTSKKIFKTPAIIFQMLSKIVIVH
jgi:hypothetical protein